MYFLYPGIFELSVLNSLQYYLSKAKANKRSLMALSYLAFNINILTLALAYV